MIGNGNLSFIRPLQETGDFPTVPCFHSTTNNLYGWHFVTSFVSSFLLATAAVDPSIMSDQLPFGFEPNSLGVSLMQSLLADSKICF